MVQEGTFFPKEKPKSSLGNDRKIGVRLPEVPEAPPDESPTEYRFRLQKWARSCYGNHDERLAACCVRALPNGWGVDVVRNPATNTAHFVGLEQCSRVWTCPVCAQRITNERRKELSFALAGAKKRGYTAVLVTYTLSHQGDDLLTHVMGALSASLRDFKAGRGWQGIKHEYSVLGGIKALEITYGKNGWHPHVHELMFLDVPSEKVNVYALQKWLADRWLEILQKHGMSASYEHGIDVRTADSAIADYIAKWGRQPREMAWGAEHELARSANKKAHNDGLTPFQLLEAVSGGDARARVLFQEYARAMDGKRQLVWTAGLRALLEMPDELPDEQLPLGETDDGSYAVIELSKSEWQRCCVYELHATLLALAAEGATAAIRAVLAARGIRAHVFDEPVREEKKQSVEIPQIEQPAAGPQICEQLTLPGVSLAVYQ